MEYDHIGRCAYLLPNLLSLQCKLITGEIYAYSLSTPTSFLASLNAQQSLKGNVDDTSYMMMSIPSNSLGQK